MFLLRGKILQTSFELTGSILEKLCGLKTTNLLRSSLTCRYISINDHVFVSHICTYLEYIYISSQLLYLIGEIKTNCTEIISVKLQ